MTNYTGRGIDEPEGITTGPDGALWFTNGANNSIGRITTAGVVTNYTGTGIGYPEAITAGPDGALWFTNLYGPSDYGHGSIGRITTSGTVSIFRGSGITHPEGITAGPDGALWFTNESNTNSSIGRITTRGTISIFTSSAIGNPGSITAGPDGALWFGNDGDVGRITTSGTVSTYSGPDVQPDGITTGPDGALWFTNYDNAIGRVTVPAPALASFSPTSGAVGAKVTIAGNALEDASSVTIDGVAAAISKDSATKIKFTVPSGAQSGEIEVTTPSGTGVSATKFTVLN